MRLSLPGRYQSTLKGKILPDPGKSRAHAPDAGRHSRRAEAKKNRAGPRPCSHYLMLFALDPRHWDLLSHLSPGWPRVTAPSGSSSQDLDWGRLGPQGIWIREG